jgi:hypothetical protein
LRRRRRCTFTRNEAALRVDNETIGSVALFSKNGKNAGLTESKDSLSQDVGEIDVPFVIDRRTFQHRDESRNSQFLGS